MKAIDALLELLGRVGACGNAAVLVNEEELHQWPKAAVKAMKSQRLIAKARPASSAMCPGCEGNCIMSVLLHNLNQESVSHFPRVILEITSMQFIRIRF